jgi:hypothetical protein
MNRMESSGKGDVSKRRVVSGDDVRTVETQAQGLNIVRVAAEFALRGFR